MENEHRARAEAYLAALGEVGSAEEEKALLTEFGEWLRANRYRIRVEAKADSHVLSCPYFPPVTPWAEHAFSTPHCHLDLRRAWMTVASAGRDTGRLRGPLERSVAAMATPESSRLAYNDTPGL